MKKKSEKTLKPDEIRDMLQEAEASNTTSDVPSDKEVADTGRTPFYPDNPPHTPVTIERRIPSFEAIRFEGMANLTNVLKFLGNDFYALTQGDPIVVGSKSVELDKKDGGLEANLLLVIRDEAAKVIHAIQPGKWIIRDPDIGYRVVSDKTLLTQYNVLSW